MLALCWCEFTFPFQLACVFWAGLSVMSRGLPVIWSQALLGVFMVSKARTGVLVPQNLKPQENALLLFLFFSFFFMHFYQACCFFECGLVSCCISFSYKLKLVVCCVYLPCCAICLPSFGMHGVSGREGQGFPAGYEDAVVE